LPDCLLARPTMSQSLQPELEEIDLSPSTRRAIARLPLDDQPAAAWGAVQSSLAAAASSTADLSSADVTSSDSASASDAKDTSAPLPLSDPRHIVQALRVHLQHSELPSPAGAELFVLQCLPHPASTLRDEAGGAGAGTPAKQPLATPLLPALRTLARSMQRFEGSSRSAPRVHIALSGLDLKVAALCGGEVSAVGTARASLPSLRGAAHDGAVSSSDLTVAAALTTLHVRCAHPHARPAAAAAAAMAALAAPGLQCLRLEECGGVGLLDEDPSMLTQMTALTRLEVVGAAAAHALCELPGLQALRITSCNTGSPHTDVLRNALCAMDALQDLELGSLDLHLDKSSHGMHSGAIPGISAALASLSHLTKLELQVRVADAAATSDSGTWPASLACCGGLRHFGIKVSGHLPCTAFHRARERRGRAVAAHAPRARRGRARRRQRGGAAVLVRGLPRAGAPDVPAGQAVYGEAPLVPELDDFPPLRSLQVTNSVFRDSEAIADDEGVAATLATVTSLELCGGPAMSWVPLHAMPRLCSIVFGAEHVATSLSELRELRTVIVSDVSATDALLSAPCRAHLPHVELCEYSPLCAPGLVLALSEMTCLTHLTLKLGVVLDPRSLPDGDLADCQQFAARLRGLRRLRRLDVSVDGMVDSTAAVRVDAAATLTELTCLRLRGEAIIEGCSADVAQRVMRLPHLELLVVERS
jgi:hypothetical protein